MLFFVAYYLMLLVGAFIPKTKFGRLTRWLSKHFIQVFFIAFLFGVSVNVAGFDNSWLYDEMIEFCAANCLVSPIYFFVWLARKNKEREAPQITNNGNREEWEQLPNERKDREKIVRRFNEKYGLQLTDEQVDNIVNGSYQCHDWAIEIMAMNQHYDTINIWYGGTRGWLHAYLKAFNVQNISTDFEFQKRIVLSSFQQVLGSTDLTKYYSIELCIRALNDRFLTSFDEATFMVAYRFLQANGIQIDLPKVKLPTVDQELQELAKKYEGQQQPMR